MSALRVYYVQERLGNRVIWTSEALTRQRAKDYKALLESEQAERMEAEPEPLTTFHLVRSFED